MSDEDKDITGKDLARKEGNGAWKPFDSNSGKEAALKRIQYQRQLKEAARAEQQLQHANMVHKILRLQEKVIDQALGDEEVDNKEMRKQQQGLDVGEKALDRLLGKATSKTQIEETSKEASEEQALDAEWVIEDDEREPETEGS